MPEKVSESEINGSLVPMQRVQAVLMLEAGRNYDPVKETPMFQTNGQAPLRATSTPDKPFGFHDATIDGGWQVPGEPYTSAHDKHPFADKRPRIVHRIERDLHRHEQRGRLWIDVLREHRVAVASDGNAVPSRVGREGVHDAPHRGPARVALDDSSDPLVAERHCGSPPSGYKQT